MGAWGSGSFENDDASDWAAELEEASDADLLDETLRAAIDAPERGLDLSEAARAVAAAEVVAGMCGRFGDHIPDGVEGWIEDKRSRRLVKTLKKLAILAVERLRNDSELNDLWRESKTHKEWLDNVDELLTRLRDE